MKYLLSILFLSAFGAEAEEPREMIEALRGEVRVEAKALPPSDPHRTALLYSLGNVLAPENDLRTDRSLRDLTSALRGLQFASNSPKVQKLCEALLVEVRQQAAQDAHEYSERVTTDLRDALRKGLAATSAEEIDAPLAQVIRLIRQWSPSQDEFHVKPALSLVCPVEDMLLSCQNLLLARQGASPEPRHDEAERLRGRAGFDSLRFAALMPRTEMQERIQAILQKGPKTTTRLTEGELNREIETLMASLRKPGEMVEVDQKITALLDGQSALGNPVRSESANRFRKWYATYQAVLKGAPLDRFSYFNISFAGTHTPIENALQPLVLARVLDLPKDLAQQEGETADDFILRAFKSACSVSDWAMAHRIGEFARLGNFQAVINRNDERGLNQLRSATTKEAAGSFAPAVTDYLGALGSGSQLIPLDQISQRLQDLRQKHPEDYAAGVEAFHNRPQNPRTAFPQPNQPFRVKP